MHATTAPADALPATALWLDLRDPTRQEEMAVEALIGAEIPTREEMREIEASSRLYSEDDSDYMTVILPFDAGNGRKEFAPVTFILSGERLITVRYTDPKSFHLFASKLCRPPNGGADPLHAGPLGSTDTKAGGAGKERDPPKAVVAEMILIGLMETVVDRLADLLEAIALDLDRIGSDIFRTSAKRAPIATGEFKELLRRIGSAGDLASHTRESLASFDRMLPFFQLVLDRRRGVKDPRARLKALSRDIQSLNDFVSFLSNKTSFLLDTTIGMITIEQNGIIKIFSVAAVGFMPPTLVASVYGMNFVHMPELQWRLGYPMALVLMAISAVLPLLYFRFKKWL